MLATLPIMGSGGFEPSKAEPTDLQSAPFDHSGNSPRYLYVIKNLIFWQEDFKELKGSC